MFAEPVPYLLPSEQRHRRVAGRQQPLVFTRLPITACVPVKGIFNHRACMTWPVMVGLPLAACQRGKLERAAFGGAATEWLLTLHVTWHQMSCMSTLGCVLLRWAQVYGCAAWVRDGGGWPLCYFLCRGAGNMGSWVVVGVSVDTAGYYLQSVWVCEVGSGVLLPGLIVGTTVVCCLNTCRMESCFC